MTSLELTEKAGPHFWSGIMPFVTTKVATKCDSLTKAQQELEAAEMHKFINANDEFHNLNSDTRITPFLVIIPGSSKKVRVVYGLGTGKGLNGLHASPIDENIMALAGDLTSTSYPNTITLPPDALALQYINVPDEKELEEKLKSVAQSTRSPPTYWFKASNVKGRVPLPCLVPIPAYVVYDAFDADIDAVILLERIMSIKNTETQCKEVFQSALSFVSSALVSYKTDENTTKYHADTFIQTQSEAATRWGISRTEQLIPSAKHTSAPSTAPTAPPPAPTTAPTTATAPAPAPAPVPANTWTPDQIKQHHP